MSESDHPLPPVPESKTVTRKRTRISLVWVIPVVAALVGVWIAVTRILSAGPTITIIFPSAEGLEAGKTKIKYEGLTVGTITALELADDHQHVVATAKMEPKSENFLVKDVQFWVVSARISGLNISGLSTLLSGDYVGVALGHSTVSERHFIALAAPPSVTADTIGRYFTLKATQLGSLHEGAPLYFRRLPAGEVVSYELDPSTEFLNVRVFIQAPYDQYVNANTRFWHASGIDMSVGADGLHVQAESLMSILAGGVAFETPTNGPALPRAEPEAVFTLFHDRTAALLPPPDHPFTYLMVFNQSVRGLEPGAPVQLKGITIGEVTSVTAQLNVKTYEFSVPVTVSIDPARYGVKFLGLLPGQEYFTNHEMVVDALVEHGLRAQLKTGSLLSGTLYVSLDFHPEAPPAKLDWSQNPVQMPTLSSDVQGIQDSLADILKKVDQLPFKAIGAGVQKTIGDLDQTAITANGALNNAGQLLDPDSALVGQLNGTLQDAGSAARALRELADYLEAHPESLVQGKPGKPK